jgi:hypothetical protein
VIDRARRYSRLAVQQTANAIAFGFVLGALSVFLFILLFYRVWLRLQDGSDPMNTSGVRRRTVAPSREGDDRRDHG